MAGPTIDRNLVLHVAKLACLSLSDAEVERFASELGRIVGYVEQLDALDTRDVTPTDHASVDRAPGRPDDVVAGLSRDEAFTQAPEVDAEGFSVPAFVE
jgi:aspartyl-tRNA(Asn)/glutamyl-tRNA(Gln) amidotransferase subunit C